MKKFFKMMKVKIKTLAAAGMKDFNPKKCEKFLKKAYNLGKSI